MADKIKKGQYKVDITTFGGFTATADDAVIDGQGGSVYSSIVNGRDVMIRNNGQLTFIPFHAVDHAIITHTTEEVDAPVDDTCVVEEG